MSEFARGPLSILSSVGHHCSPRSAVEGMLTCQEQRRFDVIGQLGRISSGGRAVAVGTKLPALVCDDTIRQYGKAQWPEA